MKEMTVTIDCNEWSKQWWEDVNSKEVSKKRADIIEILCNHNKGYVGDCRFHSAEEDIECLDGCPYFEFMEKYEDFMIESLANTMIEHIGEIIKLNTNSEHKPDILEKIDEYRKEFES